MPSVKLKCGTVFLAESSETILDAANKHNINLDYSCKDGRCGSCSSRLIAGTTELIQAEIFNRDANNMILTCCRKATSDIEIDSEDLYQLKNINKKRVPSKISKIEYVTSDVLKLSLRFPPNTKLDFLAGQYIDITKDKITRSYSIGNQPNQEKIILYIKKYKNGKMSDYLFNRAQIDDVLHVRLPLGTFFIRENERKKNLILMATGTGIAPFISILDDYKSNYEKIYLFWGNRTVNDFFVDINKKYDHLDINYSMVTSREYHDGFKGYIQKKLFETNIDIDESSIYACGSIEMINQLKELLKNNSINSNYKFYSDAFISSG